MSSKQVVIDERKFAIGDLKSCNEIDINAAIGQPNFGTEGPLHTKLPLVESVGAQTDNTGNFSVPFNQEPTFDDVDEEVVSGDELELEMEPTDVERTDMLFTTKRKTQE